MLHPDHLHRDGGDRAIQPGLTEAAAFNAGIGVLLFARLRCMAYRRDEGILPGMIAIAHARGSVPVPPECDGTLLPAHVLADLRRRECKARLDGAGRVAVDQGTPGRGSVLELVDGGVIWLDEQDGTPVLRFDLTMATAMAFCFVLSPVIAALGWFAMRSPGFGVFGAVAPTAWLCMSNVLLRAVQVPRVLREACQTAPRRAEVQPGT